MRLLSSVKIVNEPGRTDMSKDERVFDLATYNWDLLAIEELDEVIHNLPKDGFCDYRERDEGLDKSDTE